MFINKPYKFYKPYKLINHIKNCFVILNICEPNEFQVNIIKISDNLIN